jgi:hypothetical protein
VDVHHLDGHEEHGEPENLAWACRPCNVSIARVMHAEGLGRRTRQRNPADDGAQTVEQWALAVSRLRGQHDEMELADAVALVRATPAEARSRFAKEIWSIRKARYGPSGRAAGWSDVPF